MWEQLQEAISLRWQMPQLPDPVQRVRLLLLNRLLLGASFLLLFGIPILLNRLLTEQRATSFLSLMVVTAIILLAYNIHWPYSVRLTGFILVLLAAATQDMFNNGLLGHARAIILVLALLIIVLVNVRLGIAVGIVGFLTIVAVGIQVTSGRLELNESTLTGYLFEESWGWFNINLTIGIVVFVAVSLLGILIETVKDSLQEEQHLTQILTDRRLELERRVKVRNQGLATSNLISRRISTILNLNELMQAVVNEIQTAYSYGHVQIYLLNDAGYLLLQSATGQAGLKMLQAGHKIAIGRGLVGQAAETNQPVLVADVTQNPQWLPNRLLLETKSEAAIPIHLDNQVLGVLDVQHNLTNGLSEDDVYILQILAGQIAVAIQNAMLYEQVQRQAQQETQLFEIGQKLQTAADIPAVLKIASEELAHLLKAKKTHIHLG
jgi:putative methionine-R-sulfoxide reductase with GAF domain